MHLFLKRIILLILFVLQGFSPLVHAHVQTSEGMESGIHIDGFSVLSESGVEFSKLEATGHSDAVISMSTAIQQKRDLDTDSSADLINTSLFSTLHSLFLENTVGFSPHFILLNSSTRLSALAPRAPPMV